MFDRTFILPRPRTEYVTKNVNVTEQRAPTDESVKLLREMEAAVDAKRIATLKLDANGFTGHIEIWQDLAQGYVVNAAAVFDLNGKRCTARARVDEVTDGFHKIELMQNLHAEIAKVIASEVLGEGMKGLRW